MRKHPDSHPLGWRPMSRREFCLLSGFASWHFNLETQGCRVAGATVDRVWGSPVFC